MTSDVIIIGGGIVGLATAWRLLAARPAARVVVLEKESGLARHQTGHNSGVIHSGIYYKPGSAKAKNCRAGYAQLLAFCRRHGIPHEICGKVIVATEPGEKPRLEELRQRGHLNGLAGIRILDRGELREIEPHVCGVQGILVPETGIVDFARVAAKYGELITATGGVIQLSAKVRSIAVREEGVEAITEADTYRGRILVACGGLQSDRLARQTNENLPYRITPFRGEYYRLNRERRFLVKNLIYPVPDPAFPFLGVHFTRMIDGEVEAGPNAVLALKREGYRKTDFSWTDTWETLRWPGFRKVAAKYWRMGAGEFYRSLSKAAFVRALQRLVPEVRADDLQPAGAGVRAQACHISGHLVDDFVIVEQRGVIHVCNAPSPAATASLAIGEEIARRALAQLK